jgi:hypothetical protein
MEKAGKKIKCTGALEQIGQQIEEAVLSAASHAAIARITAFAN